MTTPILTKAQQRKSLSAKKGTVKGLKNILAQPHDDYWPLLKNDEDAELQNLLMKLFPPLKIPMTRINWSDLRKMSKEERKEATKSNRIKYYEEYDNTNKKYIVCGINEVTRLLEKDEICCILCDANINPSLLIKHIIVMAQSKRIPILIVSFLSKITLKTIGFSSAAIGLKKIVKDTPENYFYALFKKVSDLLLQMPILKKPISLFQEEIITDSEQCYEDSKSVQKIAEDIKIEKSVSADVYLYRTSKKERIFHPSNSSANRHEFNNAWADFIALNNDKYSVNEKVNERVSMRFFESENSNFNLLNLHSNSKKVKKETKELEIIKVQSNKCEVSYKPLKIKRLQGNELRTKATKPPKIKKK